MGCDIHIILERRQTGMEWLGIWCSDVSPGVPGRALVAQRDYGFFSEVASVRGSSSANKYPQNLPVDVSRLARLQYMRAPTDYHSVSHMSLVDFVDVYRSTNPTERPGYRPDFALHDLFGVDLEWPVGCEYRVVFWFDN